MIKRLLDVVFSASALLLLAPLMALIAFAIRCDSRGPIFYRQQRVGRDFSAFRILKFRTMTVGADHAGPLITCRGDLRVTRAGHLLRRLKWDELPQLWNVLRGEMSLVGPRPEVPRYVDLFRREYAVVLQVRPGLTDLASLHFHDEAALLNGAADPEQLYVASILPRKLRLSKLYLRSASLGLDCCLILRTLKLALGLRSKRRSLRMST